MTQTQIIYDETGYILSIQQGNPTPREPIGVPFLNVGIPSGKQIKITDGIGVDVTKTPHVVILEDIPPSEIEVVKQKNEELSAATLDLADIAARQDSKLREQGDALLDLANTLAEVLG